MPERQALARDTALPVEVLMAVSKTYVGIAEKVIGRPLVLAENPRQEIIDALRTQFALID
jgi:phosphoribosylaminoimidazole-succinocarboxamide synthase